MTKKTANIVKVGVNYYLPNSKINQWSNFNSKRGVKYFGMSQNFVCTLVYPICIQTYDQVSILRIWSKLRLHLAVLLGFCLKMPKIALNIVKVGMHSYLPNAHLNQWLNFNSNKLVKSETPLFMFLCVPHKWVSKSTFKFDF